MIVCLQKFQRMAFQFLQKSVEKGVSICSLPLMASFRSFSHSALLFGSNKSNDFDLKQPKGLFPFKDPHSPQELETLLRLQTDQSLDKAASLIVFAQDTYQKNQKLIEELKNQLNSQTILSSQQLISMLAKITNSQAQIVKQKHQRELNKTKLYAVSDIAKEVVNTSDYIKKCVQLAEESKEDTQDMEKINGCKQMLLDTLEHYGIFQFDPLGQDYDPNEHESIYLQECGEGDHPNKIHATVRTGFRIHGRLLRPAQVGVFK